MIPSRLLSTAGRFTRSNCGRQTIARGATASDARQIIISPIAFPAVVAAPSTRSWSSSHKGAFVSLDSTVLAQSPRDHETKSEKDFSTFPMQNHRQGQGQHRHRHLFQQRRHYHATSKREILPLIAVGAVIFVGRYTWKALNRMDEEWEEYQWELQQYEKAHRQDFVAKNAKYPDGTLAVDVGTMFLKLAHNGNGLLATREGSRSTFAGLVRTSDDGSGDGNVLLGQQALEKYWEVAPFHPERVDMARKSYDNSSTTLLKVITPAIQDALDRANLHQSKMRSVVTVPASAVANLQDPRNPWNSVTVHDTWKDAEWIPEPVASVWGAQVQGDLPLHDLKKPVLVIDMGAYTTSLSIVEKDVVQASVTVEFGAQVYVDAVCDYVVESQEGLSTVKNDGMAWQRLVQAAQDAVQELNTKSDAQLNVPYIGMDMTTRKPIHLEMRIPRKVIETKVADEIVTTMILKHEDGTSESILSPHVPVVPHNMSSLWMSLMTQLLTGLNQQPQDLGHVLVVGGGAKHAKVEASIKECFEFFQTKVVLPALSTRSELVVLGASSILPQYEYNLDEGLIRLEDPEESS